MYTDIYIPISDTHAFLMDSKIIFRNDARAWTPDIALANETEAMHGPRCRMQRAESGATRQNQRAEIRVVE